MTRTCVNEDDFKNEENYDPRSYVNVDDMMEDGRRFEE